VSTSSKDGAGKMPSTWDWGAGCWCNVTHINNKTVSGAWVYLSAYTSVPNCLAGCAGECSYCFRSGGHYSCTRSALLAPL
jgi:hypothetical protein